MTFGARPYGHRPYGDFAGVSDAVVNADVTLSASLTGTATGSFTLSIAPGLSAALNATAAIAPTLGTIVFLDASLTGRASLLYKRSTFFQPGIAEDFRPEYRLVVAGVDGTKYTELEQANITDITWELNQPGQMTFTVPVQDTKTLTHVKIPQREVQVWRGDQLLWAGVMTRATSSPTEVTVTCQGLLWYFNKRFVGKADRTNYIENPSFEAGLGTWDLDWAPWEAIADRTYHFFIRSLTRSVLGRWSLFMQQTNQNAEYGMYAEYEFLWTVDASDSPEGDVWTLVAWAYIPSSQYVGATKEQWGLSLGRYSTTETVDITPPDGPTVTYPAPIENTILPINDETPKDVWIRFEIALTTPPKAGEAEFVQVRLHCPFGAIFWDEVSLTRNERLAAYDEDQTNIAKRLIEHAQDTDYGKSDLNIGTSTPGTGVLRTREYFHSDHELILDLLNEFPTLNDGFDYDIVVTPSSRTFTTYYPRKGNYRRDLMLELGKNVDSVNVDVDGERTANSIVVLGDGEGSDREEGAAVDADALDGLILESVYNATPGSAIQSLDQQAKRGLERFKTPLTVPQVSTINVNTDLVGNLQVGDTVPVKADLGWVAIDGDYRVIRIALNPQTDTMSLDLNPVSEVF